MTWSVTRAVRAQGFRLGPVAGPSRVASRLFHAKVIAVAVVALELLCAHSKELQGQQVRVIPGDSTYCDCRVALEHIVTLGDTAGPGALLGEVRQVRRDSEGTYYVLAWREHQIYRFTPRGVALPAIVRSGEGPGEALRITNFAIVADSVITFDGHNARMTVFDPEGQVSRTMPAPGGYIHDAAYFPTVGAVVNARGHDDQSLGLPYHFFAPDGRAVRSFGGEGLVGIDAGLTWTRHIVENDDAIWSAAREWYELERWTLDGRRTHHVERRMVGFEPRLHRSWGGPDEPIKPWINDVAVDRRGYVRTIILRGGPRWAELLPPATQQPATGDVIYPAEAGMGLFETVIEIIDPDSGRLYARGVLEPELYGFVDPEHAFSYSMDEMGLPTISIWRLRLAPTSPPSLTLPS